MSGTQSHCPQHLHLNCPNTFSSALHFPKRISRPAYGQSCRKIYDFWPKYRVILVDRWDATRYVFRMPSYVVLAQGTFLTQAVGNDDKVQSMTFIYIYNTWITLL